MIANDQQVLGYRVTGPDNGSFMYEGELDAPVCPECWLVTDPEWVSRTFVLRRRRFDLSYTYDGALIASDRFLDATRRFAGLRSTPLPSVPGFHLLVATQEVEFDSAKRETTFEGPCPTCGRFTAVAGATPVFLVGNAPVPSGFGRSDVVFGSANGPGRAIAQHPLLFASADAVAALAATNVDPSDITAISAAPNTSASRSDDDRQDDQ